MNSNLDLANRFYQSYYLKIFNEVFYVLIDKLHGNGFSLQAQILQIMIQVLDHVGSSEHSSRCS